MRPRATGQLHALYGRGGATPRPVLRHKHGVATSHCAGSTISYAVPRHAGGYGYHFDRECFCLSPEVHGAQFLDGTAPQWVKGHA